jgi:TP901 family phage tail tape measure protein
MAEADIRIVITALDRASATVRKVKGEIDALDRAGGNFGAGAGQAGSRRSRPGSSHVPLSPTSPHPDAPSGIRPRHGPGGMADESVRSATMMTPLGIAPGMLAGGAGALSFVKATAAAADFESMLTSIQKKASTTNEETSAIGKDILDLATSGELAVSIEEIAAAYERAAAGGLPIGELKEFAKLSSKAADAFEMSSTDVGNAAMGFNKVLKIPMSGMERYFDLINSLADSGIADESDIVNFADRAGASLKMFGLTNEEIAALGSSMLILKIPAEVAANAMKTLTTRIRAPETMDNKGQVWLQKLVGDVYEFQKLITKDANGALLKLLENIDKLDEAEKPGALAALAGGNYNDNVATLVAGLDEYRRSLKLVQDEASWKGSLGSSYDLKLDDFWSQWQTLKNEAKRLTIDVGDMGMPAAKAALEGMRSVIQEISAGLEAFKVNIDPASIAAAKSALGELVDTISEALNIDTSGSQTTLFFTQLAQSVNEISDGIAKTAGLIDVIIEKTRDPFGLNPKDEKGAPPGIGPTSPEWRPVIGDGKGLGLNVEKGSIADTVMNSVGDAVQAIDDRHDRVRRERGAAAEVANQRAAEDRSRSLDAFAGGTGLETPASSTRAGRGGRVGPPGATPPPVDPSRFATTPAQAAEIQATASIDIVSYMAGISTIDQAKVEAERPIYTSAGLNTAAFLAGLGTMQGAAAAAVAQINATLAGIHAPSVGAGGGNEYGATRRAQFAPVTPGGGL